MRTRTHAIGVRSVRQCNVCFAILIAKRYGLGYTSSGPYSASNPRSNARAHCRRKAASFRRWVSAVFREIPADLQAATTFAVVAKDERNDSRHGNGLGTDFGRRLDIITAECSNELSHGDFRRKEPLLGAPSDYFNTVSRFAQRQNWPSMTVALSVRTDQNCYLRCR